MRSTDFIRIAARRPETLLVSSGALMLAAGLLIWTNARPGNAPPLRGSTIGETARTVSVEAVAATKPIRRGEIILATDLSLRGLLGAAPARVLTAIGAAAGHVALADVGQGQILFSDSVSSETAAAGIAPLVPEGERAFAIRVAEEDIAGGFVRPGDHVDVFVTLPGSVYAQGAAASASDIDRSKGALLLQNVAVLALGNSLAADNSGKSGEARTVTLALAPPALARLALAARIGRIALAIRNPDDTVLVTAAEAELSDLLGPGMTPAPPRAPTPPVKDVRAGNPPGTRQVVFYSGAAKSTLAVAP
jgi:pilus assembly protein CpaB